MYNCKKETEKTLFIKKRNCKISSHLFNRTLCLHSQRYNKHIKQLVSFIDLYYLRSIISDHLYFLYNNIYSNARIQDNNKI